MNDESSTDCRRAKNLCLFVFHRFASRFMGKKGMKRGKYTVLWRPVDERSPCQPLSGQVSKKAV